MAREAYRSLYGDLKKLKDSSLLENPAGGTGDDDELFQLLLAVSQWVEEYCDRFFAPITRTLYFDGPGGTILPVPDLISVTSIKEDENEDKTFEVTWAATDYFLKPHNADPTNHWGHPYTYIEVRDQGDETDGFTKTQYRFEIVGIWGYTEHKEDAGTDLNDASMNTTKTTIAVDDGTKFEIGQTIMIGTEQMLITNISTNDLTCTRALNGTTAAAHADDSDIYILRWPPPVERAALITAARLWERAPKFEPFYVDSDLDTDVRLLLEPYRRRAA